MDVDSFYSVEINNYTHDSFSYNIYDNVCLIYKFLN